MRRREFIAALGGTAVAWPLAVRAQQTDRVRRIGVIGPRPENAGFNGVGGAGYPTMLDELRKLGFSEGRNLSVEYRSIEQESRAVFADAAELVRHNADVLVAVGPEAGLQAAHVIVQGEAHLRRILTKCCLLRRVEDSSVSWQRRSDPRSRPVGGLHHFVEFSLCRQTRQSAA